MLSPISITFVAASAGVQAKGALYRFRPARTGESPDWSNSGRQRESREVTSPITDKSYWEGRYALCELTLENEAGERLVLNDAVVAVSRAKNIVTTQLVGRDGTVKEYINSGDYQLNIVVGVVAVRDGVIVDEYPEEGLRELRAFLEENKALSVHSVFLDLWDINRVVIKNYSLTQATESNYQTLSISALSDEEYSIYSTEY